MTKAKIIILTRMIAMVAICLWLYPQGLGWLPLGLLPSVFPTVSTCASCCTATGTSVTFGIAGITNVGCANCNSYNGALSMPFIGCGDTKAAIVSPDCASAVLSLVWSFGCGGTDVLVNVLSSSTPIGNASGTPVNLGPKPIDCSTVTVSPALASYLNTGQCDHSGVAFSLVVS